MKVTQKWMKPAQVKKPALYLMVGGEYDSADCGEIVKLQKNVSGKIYHQVCDNASWKDVYLTDWYDDIKLLSIPELP